MIKRILNAIYMPVEIFVCMTVIMLCMIYDKQREFEIKQDEEQREADEAVEWVKSLLTQPKQ